MRTPPMLAIVSILAACGDDGGSQLPIDAPAGTVDAAPDAPGGVTCTGACRTTSLAATFGSDVRTLDRAYYGITKTATTATLHLEAYKGGGAGCPTMTSPTPDYTMILGSIPITTTGTSPGNLLDFTGDLLDGPLGAAATSVTLSGVRLDVCPTCVGMPAPADPDGFAALDASLVFAAGTIQGHVFATHCDSLDEAL